jgi:hypothetical protein
MAMSQRHGIAKTTNNQDSPQYYKSAVIRHRNGQKEQVARRAKRGARK